MGGVSDAWCTGFSVVHWLFGVGIVSFCGAFGCAIVTVRTVFAIPDLVSVEIRACRSTFACLVARAARGKTRVEFVICVRVQTVTVCFFAGRLVS